MNYQVPSSAKGKLGLTFLTGITPLSLSLYVYIVALRDDSGGVSVI